MAADIELDVPEDLHARLELKAAAAGLSVSDYLLRLFTEIAEQPFVAPAAAFLTKETDGGERR